MRKNSPRKWLHAILDLLPVILIPVFMIYSHRHTIDSYSVTRQERENQPFNFYQYIRNGKPNSNSNWDLTYVTYDNNEFKIQTNNGDYSLDQQTADITFNVYKNHFYYFKFDTYLTDTCEYSLSFYTNDDAYEDLLWFGLDSPNNYTLSDVFEFTYDDSLLTDVVVYGGCSVLPEYATIKNIQLFDLTQIFGSGNEPTKAEFESMLTQAYYNYGNNYVDNYVMVSKTYNDTDIMSQFTYNLYNSVDKYFNMGNVFGMNNVYSWVETNIFHGTAPLYIYIVWNIILYEFVMDLLFLLYALFMWFIDVTKRLIEKPLDSIK